jgi:hypothetical protein
MRHRPLPFPLLTCLALAAGCGTNLLKSTEKKDPPEDATLALERHDETAAISILERALDGDPTNPQLLSILSTAYAQRAGIEPLVFAERLASSQSQSGGDSGGGSGASNFTSMFSLMPEATTAHLSDLDRAVEILTQDIPADLRQPGDVFKFALYQTASVILHTKALDRDGDGKLSAAEILDLSDGSAAGLIGQIAQAAALLSGTDSADTASQKAAEALSKYQSAIDAAPGDTQTDKMRNYLAANSSAVPAGAGGAVAP